MSGTALLLRQYRATSSGGDVTAPVLSGPAATEAGDVTYDGSVTTDEGNGTLYWVFQDGTATFPTAAQVKAGNKQDDTAADESGDQSVSSSGVQNFSGAGSLTEDTLYYLFFVHTDAAGNDSNVVRASGFTTDVVNPTLQSAVGTPTGATLATGTVSTNENDGTVYGVITQSATTPTAAQIRAGQNHLGASADAASTTTVTTTGSQGLSFTGLTASTTYYFHATQRDTENNDSAAVSSVSFQTLTDDPSLQEGATIGSGFRGPFGF